MTKAPTATPSLSLAACAAALLISHPAAAEEWTGSVGLGVVVTPDYEGSDDYQVLPGPKAELRKGGYGIKTNGLGLEADLTESRRFNAGPIVRFRFGRDDDVEDSAVSLLDEVDESLEIGGFVSYGFANLTRPGDFAFFRLSAAQDVLGGHDGFVAEASAGYFHPIGPDFTLGGIVSTSYASDDYMDAFFSVDAAEAARSGLSQSDADGGFKDVGLTLTIGYTLNDSWSINGAAGYRRLLGDAADSSVVDEAGDANQGFGTIGLSYDF